jgi:putative transposase
MISKYTRYNIPRHAHELTFSCYKRQPFLKSEKSKISMIDSIKNAMETHNFTVWAYVLMPEHVHMMIYPRDEEYSISMIFKSIKVSVARRVLNRLRENKSPYLKRMETWLEDPKYRFWQYGGGYDRNYITHIEIKKQIDYEHENPGRRGLVMCAVDYRWSSAGFWICGSESLIPIDVSDLSIV